MEKCKFCPIWQDYVASQKFLSGEWRVDTETGRIFDKSNKEVCGSQNNKGYLIIGTNHGGDRANIQKHRAVYIGRYHGLVPANRTLQIDHINGDKTDNRIDNLRLVTPAENCRNPNTHWKYCGKNNHNAKIDAALAAEIRERYSGTQHLPKGGGRMTQKKLAFEYGISQQQISRILKGKIWQESGKVTPEGTA